MPTQIRASIPTTPQDDCVSMIVVTKTPYQYQQNKDMHNNDTSNYVDFVCDLGNNGHHIPVQGTNDQMEELQTLFIEGHLVSGTSTIEGMPILDNNVAYLPPGKVSINTQGTKTNRVGDRSLSISSNNMRQRYILAVRFNWQSEPCHCRCHI